MLCKCTSIKDTDKQRNREIEKDIKRNNRQQSTVEFRAYSIANSMVNVDDDEIFAMLTDRGKVESVWESE